MGQTPEELREELSAKREDLSRDLEAIGDRVSPGRMVERRQAAVKMKFSDLRERAMGAKDAAGEHLHSGAGSTASTMTDAVSRVGETTRARTEGNPLAVGLVAFGAGLVAATVFPATRREQQLAQQAQPALEQAAAKVAPAAQHVVEEIRPVAAEAVQDLRDDAKEAATHVKEEATAAAADTKQAARSVATSPKGS
jgi:hypothetical protein